MTRWMGIAGLLIAAGIGLFLYSRQLTSIAPGAGTGPASPRATIDVTGVRNDLVAFANAEKQQYALEGKYLSLDDLRAKGTVIPADHRGPFAYTADVSDSSFRITATYSGDPQPGVPKTLAISDSMAIETQ
jgi:hypothetical protein